jgi:hypothetical protein
MTITNQVHDFAAVCSFLVPMTFSPALAFLILLRYPCSFMTFLMNVFVIPFLPFFAYAPQPLSSALYRSACFRCPSDPFHRAFPSPSFELSVLSLRSHLNVQQVVLSCKFAMPLARTIKSLANRCHPLLSRIPFTIMQKLSIPLGLSTSFIIFVPPPPLYPYIINFSLSYSPHARLSSRCCLLFYGHYSKSGLVTFSCAYHEFFFVDTRLVGNDLTSKIGTVHVNFSTRGLSFAKLRTISWRGREESLVSLVH